MCLNLAEDLRSGLHLQKKVSTFSVAIHPSVVPARALVHVDILPIVCPLSATAAASALPAPRNPIASIRASTATVGKFVRRAGLLVHKKCCVKAMGPESGLHFLGFGLSDPCSECLPPVWAAAELTSTRFHDVAGLLHSILFHSRGGRSPSRFLLWLLAPPHPPAPSLRSFSCPRPP